MTFTAEEHHRLTELREHYRSGRWPRPLGTGAIDHIELTLSIAGRTEHGLIYRCRLSRSPSPSPGDWPCAATTFHVPHSDPEPPIRDEVLQWLVRSGASRDLIGDVRIWAEAQLANDADADALRDYRGPLCIGDTASEIADNLLREQDQIRAVLGAETWLAMMRAYE